jgi:hypothetical protein
MLWPGYDLSGMLSSVYACKKIFRSKTLVVLCSLGRGKYPLRHFEKISSDETDVAFFESLKGELHLYQHWTPNWTHAEPKDQVAERLQAAIRKFSSLYPYIPESHLLLGSQMAVC